MTSEQEFLAREMGFFARLLIWATRNNGAPPPERPRVAPPAEAEPQRLAA